MEDNTFEAHVAIPEGGGFDFDEMQLAAQSAIDGLAERQGATASKAKFAGREDNTFKFKAHRV